MKLYSTNNSSNIVDLQTAVLDAFPEDRGLYIPSHIPNLDDSFINSLHKKSFKEIAYGVLSVLLKDVINDSALIGIVDRTFNFPVEYHKLNEKISILELFHGPSLAFKDFGARFMAELMSYFLIGNKTKRTILVATSGDTGGAVAAGFHGVPNIDVKILYPLGKVSPLQEAQLCGWGDNIQAIGISGVFDDCQSLVKNAFLDNDLKSKYVFSSANSINIARLIPQSLYYFEGLKHTLNKYHKTNVCVPSGNFGNITAGVIAYKMGLPINKFIAACNKNDTVPQYVRTGKYQAMASQQSLSNAMDVGDPSNFPRLYQLLGSTWNNVVNMLDAYSVSDDETLSSMKEVYDKYNYILDPHGAVGYVAVKQSLIKDDAHHVILETAHPSKFIETVEKAISKKIPIPERLKRFRDKDKSNKTCSNKYQDFKELLMFD